jgi:hypothetical protein
MKKFNLLIGVVIVAVIVVVLLMLDRTGVLVWSDTASAGQVPLRLEYDWRSLTFTSSSREYKALFKLDSGFRDKPGSVPRIKIERIIENRLYPLCEYVRDDQYLQDEHRAKAQRFDVESGKYIETLDPQIFAPLVDAMEAGRTYPAQGIWTLTRREYETLLRIAAEVAARCEGQVRTSALDSR